MSADDIPEPFVGISLWAARAFVCLGMVACCMWVYFQRDLSVVVFVPVLLAMGIGFEAYSRVRSRERRRILIAGADVLATVVGKRETPRGPVSKITVRFSLHGREYESEQTVAAATYYRVQVGGTLAIRALESDPTKWMPT